MRLLLAALFFAMSCAAQQCAATPEAAAAGIVSAAASRIVADDTGYRVQDVQFDPVMKRVWVRVGRCGNASAPLILVPVRANLAVGTQGPQPALDALSSFSPGATVPAAAHATAPLAVHLGDAVKAIFFSSSVQMEMDATAMGAAPIGGPVEIALARRGDEPAHRMHGVLRASGRVEVQP